MNAARVARWVAAHPLSPALREQGLLDPRNDQEGAEE